MYHMSDLVDVLSDVGLRTGEILSRADVHRLGKRHRAVHLYILNSKDEVLLQKRALTVDHYPGLFGISVTGHVQAGEFSSHAVRREVLEELGLDASHWTLHFLFSFFQAAVLSKTYLDHQFNDIYVTCTDIDPSVIEFDRSEIAELRFVPFRDFSQDGGRG